MGYPRLIDEGTRGCGAITPSATKRKWLNYAADQSVEGIELRPAFKDHQACSAEPWINGVDLNRYTEIFHPDYTGHAGVYTWLLGVYAD
jgi:hypothetical protein